MTRLSGGPGVAIGFALVYAAFAGALGWLWWLAAGAGRARSTATVTPPAVVAAALGLEVATVGFLWAPAIEWRDGRVLAGWTGLDVVSTVTIVVLALGSAAGAATGRTVTWRGGAACQAGLLLGNTAIQQWTDRPTDPRWGLYAASASAAALVALSWAVRRRPVAV